MKHLKSVNEWPDGEPQPNTFEQINSSELNSTDSLPFSKEDLEIIKNTIGYDIQYREMNHMINIGKIPDWGHGHIFQKEDEWFYVFCVIHHFGGDKIFGWKCDQLQGLIDCLKYLTK